LYSTLFFGCKKFVEAPKETCFIPYVDFVVYNVNPNTLEVSFTSITSYNGVIKSHEWDFGDGTTFTGEIPAPHKYPAQNPSGGGSAYRVRYRVTNDCGEAYWTDSINISPCLADVKFNYRFLSDSTVEFTNTTTSGSPVTYEWNFGDSTKSNSSATTVTKVYQFDGRYTVTLKATNACGINYYLATIPICAKPIPSQKLGTSGCTTVNLDASATKFGELYQWDFGNGTVLPASPSPSSKISYTYADKGVYTIRLKVINKNGCDSAFINTQVSVNGESITPNHNWSYTSDDLQFRFSRDEVPNATSYFWDFGDGTTSTEQNPVKTYDEPGVYDLTLVAGNECGSDTFKTKLTAPAYQFLKNAPGTAFRQVIVVSFEEIYLLGEDGKLYKTDTSGNWTSFNLPSGLSWNTNTRLFKDINGDIWVYGRNDVARFNPSTSTWTSLYPTTDYDRNTTIDGIAIDKAGNLWTIADREIRRNGTKISSSGNNNYSSIVYDPATGKIWITATNRNVLYSINENSKQLNEVVTSGILGGADNIQLGPEGDLYFSTSQGITRTSNAGIFKTSYNALTTNSLLAGPPKDFRVDNEGNIWVLYNGRLVKVPANSLGAKNYAVIPELANLASLDVIYLGGSDNDILVTKTTGNGAIQIK
jgi:PKD repeat protein